MLGYAAAEGLSCELAQLLGPYHCGNPYARHSVTGNTPLLAASSAGHTQCVRLLLAAGADVEAKGRQPYNRTPLIAACERGHAECTRLLLGGGASTTPEWRGRTAAQWAKAGRHTECLEQFENPVSTRVPPLAAEARNAAIGYSTLRGALKRSLSLSDAAIAVAVQRNSRLAQLLFTLRGYFGGGEQVDARQARAAARLRSRARSSARASCYAGAQPEHALAQALRRDPPARPREGQAPLDVQARRGVARRFCCCASPDAPPTAQGGARERGVARRAAAIREAASGGGR